MFDYVGNYSNFSRTVTVLENGQNTNSMFISADYADNCSVNHSLTC